MSSTALLHSFLRLLALTILPSALVAWGAADQLSGETDQRFQITAVEECLTLATRVDDNASGDTADALPFRHPPRYLTTGLQIPRTDFHPSGGRLLSDPGLPRAPPA